MAMRIKFLGNHSKVGAMECEVRPGVVVSYDSACEDYDWLFVYDELPSEDTGSFRDGYELLRCPRERTILATWEPVSIKSYSRAYTRQFGHLLSNRPPEAEGHPHYHLGRGYFSWFHGHTLEELQHLPAKDKVISTVCSSKQMRHTGHHDRYVLTSAIAKAIPDFDWYGHGVRPLERKCDALDRYKYHLAVENHIGVHHWTEKFADAILCECLPFYAGDPAIAEIFPQECFIPIPIDDPVEAIRIIRQAIVAGEYEKRRTAILVAKRLILERYNLWDQVLEVIRESEGLPVSEMPSQPVRLYSRRALRKHSLSALLEDGWSQTRRMIRQIG